MTPHRLTPDDPLPGASLLFPRRPGKASDASVIAQKADGTETFSLAMKFDDGRLHGDIGRHDQHLASLSKPVCGKLKGIFLDVGEYNVHTFGYASLGDGEADSTSGSRDDSNLPGQVSHRSLLSTLHSVESNRIVGQLAVILGRAVGKPPIIASISSRCTYNRPRSMR